MFEQAIGLGKVDSPTELGRDGFGIVYRASDSVPARDDVQKMLHPQLMNNILFSHRFRAKIRSIDYLG